MKMKALIIHTNKTKELIEYTTVPIQYNLIPTSTCTEPAAFVAVQNSHTKV